MWCVKKKRDADLAILAKSSKSIKVKLVQRLRPSLTIIKLRCVEIIKPHVVRTALIDICCGMVVIKVEFEE